MLNQARSVPPRSIPTTLANARPAACGFTLVEVLIAVAVLAVVAALGLPTMRDWIQNNQIKGGGHSILSGLGMARAEAIRRNTRVSFVLVNPDTAGDTRWCIIRSSTNFDCLTPSPDILTQSATEGAASVMATVTPNGAQGVTFDSLGRACLPPGCTSPYTQIDISAPAMNPADSIDLRIVIEPGGAARLCIPDLGDGAPIPPAGDIRRCA